MWTWRPKEGWFSLCLSEDEEPNKEGRFYLREVESAVAAGQRTRVDRIEDVDLLVRARTEGWDGT